MKPAATACQLRPMIIADYEAVIRLWETVEGVGLIESDTRPAIESYLARNPGLSFVACVDGAIVGAVLCGHDGRQGYLHHLAVAQSHQGRGLGRRLVECCLSGLQKSGISKCKIFPFTNNADGAAFWEHIGWLDRRDLRVMQKAVGQPE